MARLIKFLLCESKDLSLDPRTHLQLGLAAHTCNPNAGEAGTKG